MHPAVAERGNMLGLVAEQSRFCFAGIEILFMAGAAGLLGGWMRKREESA